MRYARNVLSDARQHVRVPFRFRRRSAFIRVRQLLLGIESKNKIHAMIKTGRRDNRESILRL